MTIETHSQKLRQVIERTKRHRVEATLKRVKRDVVSHRQLLYHLQQGDTTHQKQLVDLQRQYEDNLIKMSTTAYRELVRVHQLLITFTPYIPMTVEAHTEMSHLNYELYLTVEQLRIPSVLREVHKN